MLGEVEETVYIVGDEDGQEDIRVCSFPPASLVANGGTDSLGKTVKKSSEMLFVRGNTNHTLCLS